MIDEVRVTFGKSLIALLEGGPTAFRHAVHSSPQPTVERHRYAIWLCYMACRRHPGDWAVATKMLSAYGRWVDITDLQLHRLAQWDQWIREVCFDGCTGNHEEVELRHARVSA